MKSPHKRCAKLEPRCAFFPQARLAEAWIPYQYLGMLFDPTVGLIQGTIYPELVRPYKPHPHIPDEAFFGR